jgi:NAD-dependent dihydropyrimidine dehydrogenase PreA subunit
MFIWLGWFGCTCSITMNGNPHTVKWGIWSGLAWYNLEWLYEDYICVSECPQHWVKGIITKWRGIEFSNTQGKLGGQIDDFILGNLHTNYRAFYTFLPRYQLWFIVNHYDFSPIMLQVQSKEWMQPPKGEAMAFTVVSHEVFHIDTSCQCDSCIFFDSLGAVVPMM